MLFSRHWREVAWTGEGHHTKVNATLGALLRYYYPGMVTVNGEQVAARFFEHWALKENVDGQEQDQTCRGAVWKGFWVSLLLLQ